MEPFSKIDFEEISHLKARLSGFQFEFFQAVYHEDIALFIDLGGMEANLNFAISDNEANVLHLAVFRGSTQIVKLLMGCSHLELTKKNRQGQNACHIAAIYGHLPILQFLLHKSEERLNHQEFCQDGVNAEDNKLMLPIHYAVLKGYVMVVAYLIKNKAEEMAFKATCDQNALTRRMKRKRKLFIDDTMENQLNPAEIRQQKMDNYIEKESVLISQKQKELVNSKQLDEFTPALYACHRGNLDMLKLLMLYGADVRSMSRNGVTCLHLACVSGSLDVVKYLLLEHDFDCRIKSAASGSQPIHLATNAGHTIIVEYLVQVCSVDPRTEDRNGENCLTLAIKNRKREVGIWLVKTGKFQLDELINRRGFNYFAYAMVKGQQVLANEILQMLKSQSKDSDEVLNQKIDTPGDDSPVTLFDLFINRKYKSGLKFLLNVCKVTVGQIQQEQAMAIINKDVSSNSITDNGVSMAATIYNPHGSTHGRIGSFAAPMVTAKRAFKGNVRRITLADTVQEQSSLSLHRKQSSNQYSSVVVEGRNLPQLNSMTDGKSDKQNRKTPEQRTYKSQLRNFTSNLTSILHNAREEVKGKEEESDYGRTMQNFRSLSTHKSRQQMSLTASKRSFGMNQTSSRRRTILQNNIQNSEINMKGSTQEETGDWFQQKPRNRQLHQN